MKITGWFFLFISLLGCTPFSIKLEAAQFPMGGLGNMGGMGGGMLPMPSEDELREIEKFLSTLSPEELDQLAQLGEEIIKKAEEEKVPLFFDQKTQQPLPGPTFPKKEEKIAAPTKQPEAPKKVINKDVVDEVKDLLFRLIENIDAIRQKASHDQELEDTLSELDEQLNKILYYLYVVNDKKVSVHLKDKEFSDLYKKLQNLDTDLDSVNNTFDVPTFGIMTRAQELKHKKAVFQAEIILNKIIKRFKKAFDTDKILDDITKLIEKYEPEALKVKANLEQLEKKALEYSKKIPVTNTGKLNPIPHHYGGGYDGGWNNTPPGGQVYQPGPYSARQQPTAGFFGQQNSTKQSGLLQPQNRNADSGVGAKGSKKSRQGSTDDENENEDESDSSKKLSKSKELAKDFENSIKTQIDAIKSIIVPQQAALDGFFANYKTGQQPTDQTKKALDDANFALKKLKTTSQKWHSQINKEAKSASDFMAKTKPMADFYDSANMKSLRDLHTNLKIVESAKIKLDGSIKKFKDYMDDFEKKAKGDDAV